jgi:8-oxo-dGTP pyrophosphatase MutT (NUDIX family)
MSKSAEHNPWTTLSVDVRYESPWLAVEHHEVIKPNGQPGIYGVVRTKKMAVGVLPLTPDGRVHLVGQWRYALNQYSWEMPEGGCEPDEQPAACAQREMAEEAGVTAGQLVEVVRLHTSNSVTDEAAICYVGWDLAPATGTLDDTEVIARTTVPFRHLLDMVVAGEVTDALTVVTVLRAYHMAQTGGLPAALSAAMLAAAE